MKLVAPFKSELSTNNNCIGYYRWLDTISFKNQPYTNRYNLYYTGEIYFSYGANNIFSSLKDIKNDMNEKFREWGYKFVSDADFDKYIVLL